MAYVPPKHILLRRQTNAITDRDLAFLEQALTVQLIEVAEAYGLSVPGVSLVTPDTHLPSTEAVGIDFVDDDGQPGSAGHHGWSEAAKFPWALVGVKEAWSWEQAASHEALEPLVNLYLDQWVETWSGPMARAEFWAKEICDPVEEDSYWIPCQLFGERRNVRVSNWVTPAYWSGSPVGPWDKLGKLSASFTLSAGGYALVRSGGVIHDLGAARSLRHGTQAKARPASRVAQIRSARPAGSP